MIRNATIDDAAAICNIYNHYVLHTLATFEEVAITDVEMTKRILEVQSIYAWLVYEEGNKIMAYANAHTWRPWLPYKHTAETSIYIDREYTGKGIGRALYTALIKKLAALNVHTAIGGILLPNEASVRLHESMGFRKMGQFNEIGFKAGKWIDLGYWDMLLQQPPAPAEVPRHVEYYY